MKSYELTHADIIVVSMNDFLDCFRVVAKKLIMGCWHNVTLSIASREFFENYKGLSKHIKMVWLVFTMYKLT
jgi:hypothetical protein